MIVLNATLVRNLFILTCLLWLTACQHTTQKESTRINQDDYVSRHVEINLDEFKLNSGEYGVQVHFLNSSNTRRHIQYRFYWFTKDGQSRESPTSTWIPVSIDPQGMHVSKSLQPTPDANDFKLSVKQWKK